jgi:hypothetical protein
MNLFTRIGIVLCTLLACYSAWDAQRRDKLAARDPLATDLYDVIQSQVVSLRQQRYQQAYLQVSRTYQNSLGLEGFLEAARMDGMAIRQAARWEFGAPEEKESNWEVPVFFYSPQGDLTRAVFLVVRENGVWKIDWLRVAARADSARSVAGIRL